jgi:hypothetical protein
MMKYFSIVCAAIILVSCGGGKKGGLSKDTKADFQFNQAQLDSLGGTEIPEADRAKYEGKVVEIKGIVKTVKKEGPPSPNKYSFYLVVNATDESGAIIYTDEDPTAMEGKAVTVKGKFDYAGVVTLDDSAVY